MRLLKDSKIYKIDGLPIPQPSACTVGMEDLETKATRNIRGYLIRVRARQGVRKVSLSYSAITQEEVEELVEKLEPETFLLSYLDPRNGVKTIQCYCSKKDLELHSAISYNGLWVNVKFNCIEV